MTRERIITFVLLKSERINDGKRTTERGSERDDEDTKNECVFGKT